MMTRIFLFAATCSLAIAGNAQVVQLPTIRTFGYSGSVRVPDRGTMSLGGNSTSSHARNRGVYRGSQSHGGASVSVTIIDLAAMDRQIRGLEAAGKKTSDSVRPVPTATVAEGKLLVRYARKMRAAGNDSLAKRAYELSFRKLDGRLRKLAQQEYDRFYGRLDERQATIANVPR